MTVVVQGLSSAARMRPFGTAKLSGFLVGRPDDRPPLVLLHGLTFDHRMYLPALEALRGRDPDRLVLVLDLPGHGASPVLPRCDPEDVAAAVASAVQDAGLDRPVMVGHSIAAIIVTIYACTYPTRGVVNVDQVLDTSFIRMLQANREVLTGPGFPHIWPPILASMHIKLLPDHAQRLLPTEPPPQDLVLAYWRQGLETPPADMEARLTDVVATLRRNQVPYLIVAGHEWEAEHRRRLRDELPRATLTVIPNSGHFPQLADPDRFAHLLAATGAWQASARVTPR